MTAGRLRGSFPSALRRCGLLGLSWSYDNNLTATLRFPPSKVACGVTFATDNTGQSAVPMAAGVAWRELCRLDDSLSCRRKLYARYPPAYEYLSTAYH